MITIEYDTIEDTCAIFQKWKVIKISPYLDTFFFSFIKIYLHFIIIINFLSTNNQILSTARKVGIHIWAKNWLIEKFEDWI